MNVRRRMIPSRAKANFLAEGMAEAAHCAGAR
jgi:hypothetical protein